MGRFGIQQEEAAAGQTFEGADHGSSSGKTWAPSADSGSGLTQTAAAGSRLA